MRKIEICEIDETDHKIWDDLIYHSPQSIAPHLYEWLKIIEKNHNTKLSLVCGFLGEEIIGGIPLFSRNSLFGKCIECPLNGAQLQQLGPIFKNYNDINQYKREYYFGEFWKALDEYLRKQLKAEQISIITSPNLCDARPYLWNNYSVTPKYNYIADITDLDVVRNGFKRQLRNNITKCEKAGLNVCIGGFKEYEYIYNSVLKRYKEQGFKLSTSKKYMDDLFLKFYPDVIKPFMVIDSKNDLLSGILTTTFNEKISLWFGATQITIEGLYPIDFLQWEIMKWGNQNSMKLCEFQGANYPKISYFKSRYNFKLDEYYHIKKESFLKNFGFGFYNIMKKKIR